MPSRTIEDGERSQPAVSITMKKHPVIRDVAVIAALLASAPAASAQDTGAATGTVYDTVGRPLAGIKVGIEGTRKHVKTGSDGTFRIEKLEPGQVFLRFEGGGYVGVVEKVVIDAGWTTGIDVVMTPMVAMLDMLVVEAGLGRMDGEGVGRSSRVSGDDSSEDAFSRIGRLPGVQVMRPSGSVGTGARVLMRGINSITLSNSPVIYVDGVRVNGGQAVYGQAASGPIGQGSFNLDFIDPRDIDRIEILRGPATAVRYGLDATSGVILIYTKRGGRS